MMPCLRAYERYKMAKSKEIKTNAMRILERMKIAFTELSYEPEGEFEDGIHTADMLGLPHEKVYKTLVCRSSAKDFFVFVIPIEAELDLKAAAACVGVKSVEMIHGKEIKDITGYVRGGCTSIGMKKNYPTVIDESAQALPDMYVSAGRIGAQINLKPDDLAKAAGAKFAAITRK